MNSLSKSLQSQDENSGVPQTIGFTFPESDTLPPKPSPKARLSQYVLLICTLCGNQFWRRASDHQKHQKRGCKDFYCSQECSRAHHAVKNAGDCRVCGSPKKSKSWFCSDACREESKKNWKSRTRKPTQCSFCNASYLPVSIRSQFCSRNCADAAHSLRMRGKGNSHYKNGLSYGKWFAEMRPLIMNRDNRSCIACQVPEKFTQVLWRGQSVARTNLQIHHIDHDPRNNQAENLITLCKWCHHKHHTSAKTPFQWFAVYAKSASRSMTSKWKSATTSLQKTYSYTTA